MSGRRIAAKREVLEVNCVSMICVGRRAIDLVATDERLNTSSVAWVLGDQTLQFRDRLRFPLRSGGVVECEPHAEKDGALKGFVLILDQTRRGLVEIAGDEIGRDANDGAAVQEGWLAFQAFADMNDRHDDRGAFEVRWPDCLGDVRKEKAKGQALWTEIKGLVQGELRQKRVR
jgi:hypothetical protein